MPKFSFKVLMVPVPKQYQRVTAQAGHIWAYTPESVIKAQNAIKNVVEGKGAWFAEHLGVRVTATFYRPEPDSPTVNRLRQLCARYNKPHLPVIEPDIDNYFKTLADGLQSMVYKEDSQITDMRVRKRYAKHGESPRIEFDLEEDDGT